MPKFQVSVPRGIARHEVVEVSADTPEEACWIALSASGCWKDVEMGTVGVSLVPDQKVVALRSAA